MGLGSYFKNLVINSDPLPATPAATHGQPPSARQIYQSRLNRGPNLGGLFVLEKWIAPHMFPEGDDGGKTAELDAVTQALAANNGNVDAVRQKFEDHWRNWVTDDDWQWMQAVGVTAVRVPIGYWMVAGANFCENTSFGNCAAVYTNAWEIFKEVVLQKAGQHQIGVLVDLHGLPGGANGADHSGTTEGSAKLWGSNTCQLQSFGVLQFLARELAAFDNVVGLQVLNEAPHENAGDAQKAYYLKALNQVRQANQEIPLVISDGWDLGKWVQIVKDIEADMSARRGETCSLGVLIDTHVYRCFSDDDKNKTPSEIVAAIDQAVPDTDTAVDIMVGEFSCVLDGASWDKHDANSAGSREDVVREYGRRQCAHFAQRAAGFYFWTLKFRWGGGGEWGFREMLDKGSLATAYAPLDQKFPADKAPGDDWYAAAYGGRAADALAAHQNYWTGVDANRDWEHWRFEAGFKTGWDDAFAFDKVNHSEIGRRAAWKRAREVEHVRERGAGNDIMWVWRQAFDQGVKAFLETRDQAFQA